MQIRKGKVRKNKKKGNIMKRKRLRILYMENMKREKLRIMKRIRNENEGE